MFTSVINGWYIEIPHFFCVEVGSNFGHLSKRIPSSSEPSYLLFGEAQVLVVRDDNVVDHFDAQDLSALDQFSGNIDILL